MGEKGEGSGGDGGGKWGEWGRELGMWYPPVHPLFSILNNSFLPSAVCGSHNILDEHSNVNAGMIFLNKDLRRYEPVASKRYYFRKKSERLSPSHMSKKSFCCV